MNEIHNVKKIIFIILTCTLFFSSNLFSQDKYKRKISISEWIEEMEQCKAPLYLLRNTEIYFDYSKDSLYSWNRPRTKPSDYDEGLEKNISPIVLLQNCKLPDNSTCQVRNINFQNNVAFSNCTGAGQLIFYNCTFKQGLDFHQSNLGTVEFLFCSTLQRTAIFELQINALFYSNCTFYTDHKVVSTDQFYGFERENHDAQFLFIVMQNEKNMNTFKMNHCQILPGKVIPILYFSGGKYDVINFEAINFSNSILNFDKCSVKENFAVRNCTISKPFGMNQFNFPKDNTSFVWSQIDSVGLGLYYSFDQPALTHQSDTLIADIYNYNELNSSYRKFFSMYRTQGDMESANACFIQMKDMETTKYQHLYRQNPNVNTWFNWRFNQFLKYFSEYGINPVLSLIISMWVILMFAAVYFFFYSDWDGINRKFLIKQHRKTILYFRSQQKLEDFYTENYIDDFKTLAQYKQELAESKPEMPLFITLLGKPLYILSTLRHKLFRFIYGRTEVLQGRWIDLKPTRRLFVALTVSFSLLVYMTYLVFIRTLNSITLSINVFSTLGFGSIPVKGLSRYITIIEGFLGWFLLSVFSVSLISQMLQS